MSLVQLSPTGRVACGGSFIDMYGRRPPATIQSVHSNGIAPPPLMSWSAFSTSKKLRGRLSADGDENAIPAGEHVALTFSHTAGTAPSKDLFFSVGIFRCDTWALQWAVRADSISDGRRVCDVCCLSAHTVVFTVDVNKGGKELYIATKADVPRVAKRENRQWRSFLANAHRVDTKCEGEDICTIQALSATSCLLLTATGRLIRITVTFSPQVEVVSEEVNIDGKGLTAAKNKNKNNSCSLVLSGAIEKETESSNCHAAVFTVGSTHCHVMKFMDTNAAMRVSKPQPISLPAGATVERAEFAGPHILVLTLSFNKKTTFALLMTCLVPSESSSTTTSSESPFSCIAFEPLRMTGQQVPLATMYCAEKETHVVLARRPHRMSEADRHHNVHNKEEENVYSIMNNSESAWWNFLEYAELPLREGPYTEELFRNATWCSLPDPCSTALPTVAAAAGTLNGDDNNNDDDDEDDGDKNNNENTTAEFQRELALLSHSSSGGQWEPIRLHYALATSLKTQEENNNNNGSNDIVVNVLAIETAPFVHTRLVKQWHNATRGLQSLLDGADSSNTVGGLSPFAVPWNPRHLRRALRLFSQESLQLLFRRLAIALRGSTQPTESTCLFYGAAATAVTDVALHIITLSRQVGALLLPEDVEIIAVLLRASRAVSHSIVNSTARGQLLLESAVRSRLANRVLGAGAKNHTAANGDNNDVSANEETDAAETEFLNAPAELRVERALRTQYAPNLWTQQLAQRRAADTAVVSEALRHLNALQTENKALLPDWAELGRQPHINAAFTEYESALLKSVANNDC